MTHLVMIPFVAVVADDAASAELVGEYTKVRMDHMVIDHNAEERSSRNRRTEPYLLILQQN
jgi:hypothetical protein